MYALARMTFNLAPLTLETVDRSLLARSAAKHAARRQRGSAQASFEAATSNAVAKVSANNVHYVRLVGGGALQTNVCF